MLTCVLLLSSSISADNSEIDLNLVLALKQSSKQAPSFSSKHNAVIWLADMSERLKGRIPDPFSRVNLLKTIHSEATRAQLKPELVLALIDVESGFNRFAVSDSGAQGLMQVMPFWKKEIGHPQDNLFEPHTNLRYGCTILKYYLDLMDGNLGEALAQYNGSYGEVAYSRKVIFAFNQTWHPSAYYHLLSKQKIR